MIVTSNTNNHHREQASNNNYVHADIDSTAALKINKNE